MPAVGGILMIVGVVMALVGAIMFLVASFRESVIWGIGCLLFWPVSLVFMLLTGRMSRKRSASKSWGFLWRSVASCCAIPPSPPEGEARTSLSSP